MNFQPPARVRGRPELQMNSDIPMAIGLIIIPSASVEANSMV
ncbi:MAG: hypothetical protein WAU24_07300 [Chitinophagaceae bacterium]